MNDVQLSSLIRDHASKHKATDRLRAELRTRAVLVDAARPGRDVTLHQQAGWSTWLQTFGGKWLAAWRYLAVGAGGGVMASVGIGFLVFHLQVGTLAGGDLVAAHVRAMRDGPLVQVVSTDQHTVKPWFQGKLDFAPPVVDLIDAGYALLGGRVEDFRGRPVAALAYSRDQHIINLFIEPDTATQPPKRDVVNGFNVLRWSDGVMRYALVGNIGVAEAEQFPKLWQTAWQSEQKQLPHSSLPVVSRPPPGSMQGGWLVNAKGITLYTYDHDLAGSGRSACVDSCAVRWPPYLAGNTDRPVGDWSLVLRDTGERQWAYRGRPTYTWPEDQEPGDKYGDNYKKIWHVVLARRGRK